MWEWINEKEETLNNLKPHRWLQETSKSSICKQTLKYVLLSISFSLIMGRRPIDNIKVFYFYKISRFSRDDVINIVELVLKWFSS